MQIRFWGTRGSLAKPGPKTVRFGGNTSCVEVRSAAGTRLVIDCGTGAHELGQAIMREGTPSRGHVLISHTHWDHIQGIPFFAPLFVPGHAWDIYAPQGFGESLKDTLAGQMEYTYFPVSTEAFGANVRYHNLGEGSFTIDDLTIRTRYLNHPALTLAFRIEGDGGSFAYSCDHEPHSRELAMGEGTIEGEDLAHAEFMEGVDLIIHDAQYVAPEYQAKQGWGHSTVEYAVSIAKAARARQIALTHHDPARTDDQIDEYLADIAHRADPDGPQVIAAYEGLILEIGTKETQGDAATPNTASAIRKGPAQENARLLLIGCDAETTDKVARAVASEPVELLSLDASHAMSDAAALDPSMIMVADEAMGPELQDVCGVTEGQVPCVILGGVGAPTGCFSDRLEEPWSVEYARTRIRTWLMRAECHWARPPIPDDETERVAALKRLGILDTAPEERFDRHTRIASALFKVPIALVSLVDADRQWFKSCFGTDVCESSRETSFCAHAIVSNDDMLIVPDALQDDRFRDNPMVSDGPRIRFYAGSVLHSPEGQRVGTLCILDVRPRNLSDDEKALLRDVASAVESELWGAERKAA
ncbi:MBL fold metallo-hydrolase [Sphingomonas tabacisoli]|uniref:MBL fold metallo-hydrolase n=1 Tax=Sphingomonas tabacisoli TaxID=2249466 RepID=A0ABW4I384_9SPHN